jgi:DNA-binding NtrC family response regulator
LNVLTIALPTLHERRTDIPQLAEQLLVLAAQELGRPRLQFAADVLPLLAQRHWPGNVRELKNLIRRAAALSAIDVLSVDAFAGVMPAMSGAAPHVTETDVAQSTLDASRLDASGLDACNRDAVERARTVEAIQGSRTMHDAARRLGINRSTLYRRLARFGLTSTKLLQAN